jgi:hypothetical protein
MSTSNGAGSDVLHETHGVLDAEDVGPSVATETAHQAQQNDESREEQGGSLLCYNDVLSVGATLDVENINTKSEDSALLSRTHVDFISSNVESSSLSTGGGGGKPSSIAQLVRTWESYMTADHRPVMMDQFEALQMFQPFNLCGAGDGLVRLGPPISHSSTAGDGTLLEPIYLRHTHSTPLHKTPSMLDDASMEPPVPIGWGETFNRSRSTPLTTSANSAFGAILRTMPYIDVGHDRSAFTLPKIRSNDNASVGRLNPRYSAFDPIATSPHSEMDVLSEATSIEVMKMSPPRNKPTFSLPDPVQEDQPSSSKGPVTAATSRAARFLSDVRALRRRRRERGERENPAQFASSLDDSTKKIELQELQEEVQSDLDHEVVVSSSSLNENSQDRIIVTAASHDSSHGHASSKGEENMEDSPTPVHNSYQQLLDSDADDECEHFQNQTKSHSLLDADSPATIPSPMYQPMPDDRPGSVEDAQLKREVRISDVVEQHPIDQGVERGISPEYSSPVPSSQMTHDVSNLTPHSHDSPGTSRSLSTTNTSGHTTQATSTTASSGQMSHLSSISEADREVMEANKVGTLLARQERDVPVIVKKNVDMPTDAASALDYALGYFALVESPVPLREGANVQADRFFTFAESQVGPSIPGRLRSSSSRKGHSPTTVSSASMNTNSCSSSSASDEPPIFVTYLDRQAASDLTSLREAAEPSSSREGCEDVEERESPSEILGYSNLVFEEAKAPRDETTASKEPRPIRPTSKGSLFRRRIRSLPPRSPVKGARATPTPPPYRESTSPACLSPPRTIVDHRIEPNVSRPYVLRTTPGGSSGMLSSVGQKFLVVAPEALGSVYYAPLFGDGADQGAQEVVRECSGNLYTTATLPRGSSPISGGFRSRTYFEHSIEILKTESKDESNTPSPSLVAHENRTDEV